MELNLFESIKKSLADKLNISEPIFISEKGKESVKANGKFYDFVPSNGSEGLVLIKTEDGHEWGKADFEKLDNLPFYSEIESTNVKTDIKNTVLYPESSLYGVNGLYNNGYGYDNDGNAITNFVFANDKDSDILREELSLANNSFDFILINEDLVEAAKNNLKININNNIFLLIDITKETASIFGEEEGNILVLGTNAIKKILEYLVSATDSGGVSDEEMFAKIAEFIETEDGILLYFYIVNHNLLSGNVGQLSSLQIYTKRDYPISDRYGGINLVKFSFEITKEVDVAKKRLDSKFLPTTIADWNSDEENSGFIANKPFGDNIRGSLVSFIADNWYGRELINGKEYYYDSLNGKSISIIKLLNKDYNYTISVNGVLYNNVLLLKDVENRYYFDIDVYEDNNNDSRYPTYRIVFYNYTDDVTIRFYTTRKIECKVTIDYTYTKQIDTKYLPNIIDWDIVYPDQYGYINNKPFGESIKYFIPPQKILDKYLGEDNIVYWFPTESRIDVSDISLDKYYTVKLNNRDYSTKFITVNNEGSDLFVPVPYNGINNLTLETLINNTDLVIVFRKESYREDFYYCEYIASKYINPIQLTISMYSSKTLQLDNRYTNIVIPEVSYVSLQNINWNAILDIYFNLLNYRLDSPLLIPIKSNQLVNIYYYRKKGYIISYAEDCILLNPKLTYVLNIEVQEVEHTVNIIINENVEKITVEGVDYFESTVIKLKYVDLSNGTINWTATAKEGYAIVETSKTIMTDSYYNEEYTISPTASLPTLNIQVNNGVEKITLNDTDEYIESEVINIPFESIVNYKTTFEEGYEGVTTKVNWEIISGTWNSEEYNDAADGVKYTCVSPGSSKMTTLRCTFKNVKSITFTYRSDAEGNFDYLVVSKLDNDLSSITSWSAKSVYINTKVQDYTRGRQGSWRSYTYNIEDEEEHFVDFMFGKDDSTDTKPDNAQVYISNGVFYSSEGTIECNLLKEYIISPIAKLIES